MSKPFGLEKITTVYYTNGNGTRMALSDMENRQIISAINSLQARINNLKPVNALVVRAEVAGYETTVKLLAEELDIRYAKHSVEV